jgi:hypothetical protein
LVLGLVLGLGLGFGLGLGLGFRFGLGLEPSTRRRSQQRAPREPRGMAAAAPATVGAGACDRRRWGVQP